MRGFTLFEILIVMGIVAALAAFGLTAGTDMITRGSVHAERDTVVRLLESARSRAMGNAEGSPHGVHIEDNEYVVFRGDAFDPDDDENIEVPAGSGVEVSDAEIIFEELSGRVDTGGGEVDIEIVQGPETATLLINEEGRINW